MKIHTGEFLGQVGIFCPKPVILAKVRYPRVGADAGAGQKNNALGFTYPPGECRKRFQWGRLLLGVW